MSKGYRILSIEACEIYKHEQEYGVAAGYKLPERKSDAYFWLFKNRLDDSLDTIELEKAYTRICRKKFAFQDNFGNNYTTAVVNLKFNYTYKPQDSKPVAIKQLRKYYYENGFNMDGVHYIRYKRSAGSSRQGECLFIDERLYKSMSKWGECGLKEQDDVASWESYKALSLSSIKGTIDIPLNGILFVPDYKSTFTDEVVSVEVKDGTLTAEEKQTQITNDIWDGESLLDESFFNGDYEDKHMLLLRNKFFKSCAFRTKLHEWFKDKNITLEDLKQRGFITLAEDISQIVMVSTPNSLKYLKFAGELNEKNICKWTENVNSTFGVVKWDKYTRFFHGDMVQSSYQLLNTLCLTEKDVQIILEPSIFYIAELRKEINSMRLHFKEDYAKGVAGESVKRKEGLAERADVIFTLMDRFSEFDKTALYINFCNDVVKNLKNDMKKGHVLICGTNATLFGNGPELLKYLAGEEIVSELKPGQVHIECYEDGDKLLCARSPHITMGNLYCVENNLGGDIWNYFDLGDNIVCVNAIGENIQQRLNGCDYDSDTVLVTDDEILVEAAEMYEDVFKVPVCNIPPSGKTDTSLYETDHKISVNKIGEIVNLSQKLNSLIWDKLNNGASEEEIMPVYQDVCKLAVLSGLEIDRAKRNYDCINVGSELYKIRKKYEMPNPIFFKDIDDARTKKTRKYTFYNTTMDYIVKYMNKVHFRSGREQYKFTQPISEIIYYRDDKITSTDYKHKDKVIEIIEEYKAKINQLYLAIRLADASEKPVLYDMITDMKDERDKKVAKWLTSDAVVMLVIRHYEKNSASDWRIYAALMNNPLFKSMLYQM